MRLLLISQDYPPATGGVEQYSHQVALELAKRHDVTVVAPWQEACRSFDLDQPFQTLRQPTAHTSIFGAETLMTIPSIAAATKTRVVLAFQQQTSAGAYIAKRARVVDHSYIVSHGRELRTKHLGPLSNPLRRSLLLDADGHFANSNYTRDLLVDAGVPRDTVRVVLGGIDLERFQPQDATSLRERLGLGERHVLLTAARLVTRKGIDTVIEAMKSLTTSKDDIVYLIVGSGPDRERLEKLAAPLMQRNLVRFVGRIPDEEMALYYSMADVFVMTPREESDGSVEGLGLVYLEANACGTPTIGSRSGGIPDAVEENVSGLLVTPDDATELAVALRLLIEDREQRQRLGDLGLARARGFTWAAVTERMLETIEL